MSRTRFRVDPRPIVAWMSRNSLLKTGAISKVYVTASDSNPQPLSSHDHLVKCADSLSNFAYKVLNINIKTYNPEQSKEIRQNWPGAENLDMRFCVIFAPYYKSFTSRKEIKWVLSPSNLRVFLIFPYFLRS